MYASCPGVQSYALNYSAPPPAAIFSRFALAQPCLPTRAAVPPQPRAMSSAYRERAGSAPFTPSVEGIAAIEAALAGAAASKTGLGSLSAAPGAHFTPEARAEALRMFITDLGLPAVYFEYNSVETVAKHIASMMGTSPALPRARARAATFRGWRLIFRTA
ncbi:hypothetical protein EON68_04220 [archaeon]|nr:MAG: hypothetical protein EON68_04220 [archaeon]